MCMKCHVYDRITSPFCRHLQIKWSSSSSLCLWVSSWSERKMADTSLLHPHQPQSDGGVMVSNCQPWCLSHHNSARVPSANMEGQDFRPTLQPAIRGQSKRFKSIFLCSRLSLSRTSHDASQPWSKSLAWFFLLDLSTAQSPPGPPCQVKP